MTSLPSRKPTGQPAGRPAHKRSRPLHTLPNVRKKPGGNSPAPMRKRHPARRRTKVKSPLRLILVLAVLLGLGLWAGLSLRQQQLQEMPLQPAQVDAASLEYYFLAEKQTRAPWQLIAALLQLRDEEPTLSGALRVAWNLPEGATIQERLAGMDATLKKNVQALLPRYETIDAVLREKGFPFAAGTHYSYENSWGEGRAFGGERFHEGTDIFAEYGTPVLSCSSGVVERMGWNDLGGWRVGVRAPDGMYYYYAHLSEYAPGLAEGQTVTIGQELGYVGDSGYGPQGTTGQFEPHLHFGLYQGRDTEGTEKAFSSYPFLIMWDPEREVQANSTVDGLK